MKRLELKNIIKESITDYLSELNTSVPEDSTEMALDMMKNGLPTQTKESKFRAYLCKPHMWSKNKMWNVQHFKHIQQNKYEKYKDDKTHYKKGGNTHYLKGGKTHYKKGGKKRTNKR